MSGSQRFDRSWHRYVSLLHGGYTRDYLRVLHEERRPRHEPLGSVVLASTTSGLNIGARSWVVQVDGIHSQGDELWIQLTRIGFEDRGLVLHVTLASKSRRRSSSSPTSNRASAGRDDRGRPAPGELTPLPASAPSWRVRQPGSQSPRRQVQARPFVCLAPNMALFQVRARAHPDKSGGLERRWLTPKRMKTVQPNRARVPADFDPLAEFASEPTEASSARPRHRRAAPSPPSR
jgi:hypothetical protein